jgi:Transposase DDE domain
MPPSSRSTATVRAQKGTQSQAIGRSKGGMTTKILALTDALGNLVRFVLLPGQRFDTVGVPPLIEGLAFDALIADKAFDSNVIIAELDARGAKVSPSIRAAESLSPSTRRCTNGGT